MFSPTLHPSRRRMKKPLKSQFTVNKRQPKVSQTQSKIDILTNWLNMASNSSLALYPIRKNQLLHVYFRLNRWCQFPCRRFHKRLVSLISIYILSFFFISARRQNKCITSTLKFIWINFSSILELFEHWRMEKNAWEHLNCKEIKTILNATHGTLSKPKISFM